jgi:hypothetical protein
VVKLCRYSHITYEHKQSYGYGNGERGFRKEKYSYKKQSHQLYRSF